MSKEDKYVKATASQTAIIALIVIAVIFLLSAILIFEFGSKTTSNGDTVIPWYFWLLFAIAFFLFFAAILAYIFVPTGMKEKQAKEVKEMKVTKKEELIFEEEPSYNYNISHTVSSVKKTIPMEPSMTDFDSLARV